MPEEDKEARPISDSRGVIVGYFDKKDGLSYTAEALDNSKEAKKLGNEVVDAANREIDQKNKEAVETFKKLPEYQNLSEVDRLAAVYKYREEHDLPRYLGGSGDIKPLSEETMDAFKATDYYNSLNRTEKVVAYGEFRKTITPKLAKSVDTNVYLTLGHGLSQGVFDGKEAQMAAQYMREHYKDAYDENMMINNIKKRTLALEGKEIAPNVLEERLAQEWSVRKGMRDLEVTKQCMSAIANDTTLSEEQKKEMQVQELTGYCKRCNAEGNNMSAKKKEHMLDSYPELKEAVRARLEKQQQTNNTGMNIPLMKLSSNTR